VELEGFDKQTQFLEIMQDIKRAKRDKETAIIFCNSIQSCQSTEYLLRENGYQANSIHGDVPAKLRIQNYNNFKNGTLQYLVCTDLGSRGLDFENNGYVVNFDFPSNTSDYLHRVGRTGRAGRVGSAFSLIRKKDFGVVNQLKDSFEYGVPLGIGNSSYTYF
jgi:superfamily II DNA/RNA helicase